MSMLSLAIIGFIIACLSFIAAFVNVGLILKNNQTLKEPELLQLVNAPAWTRHVAFSSLMMCGLGIVAIAGLVGLVQWLIA